MSNNYDFNFNEADEQQDNFSLIPDKTITKIMMTIRSDKDDALTDSKTSDAEMINAAIERFTRANASSESDCDQKNEALIGAFILEEVRKKMCTPFWHPPDELPKEDGKYLIKMKRYEDAETDHDLVWYTENMGWDMWGNKLVGWARIPE